MRQRSAAPLYRGLPDDMCPCEHWCYLAKGRLEYRLADGRRLSFGAGEAFHVPAGHLAELPRRSELRRSPRRWADFPSYREGFRPIGANRSEPPKRNLARRFEHDREGYTQAKAAFIGKALAATLP